MTPEELVAKIRLYMKESVPPLDKGLFLVLAMSITPDGNLDHLIIKAKNQLTPVLPSDPAWFYVFGFAQEYGIKLVAQKEVDYFPTIK